MEHAIWYHKQDGKERLYAKRLILVFLVSELAHLAQIFSCSAQCILELKDLDLLFHVPVSCVLAYFSYTRMLGKTYDLLNSCFDSLE